MRGLFLEPMARHSCLHRVSQNAWLLHMLAPFKPSNRQNVSDHTPPRREGAPISANSLGSNDQALLGLRLLARLDLQLHAFLASGEAEVEVRPWVRARS